MDPRKQVIGVLSDQDLFREGMLEIFHARRFTHVTTYATHEELLAAARARPFDLVFVDLDHEQEDVLALVHRLRRALRGTPIVIIGSALRQEVAAGPEDGALETPRAGASALVAAAEVAARHRPLRRNGRNGQHSLWSGVTERQRAVLRWLAVGADNRTIAGKLRIGERAVKAHISALLSAFGLANRTQLSLLADRAGLKPPRSAAMG